MSKLFVLVVVALVWAKQGAAINPDALKALLDPKLRPLNSIAGERCVMYEEALRNGPWGGEFANLNRSELMESILESIGNSNLFGYRTKGEISEDIRKCLGPNPTFNYLHATAQTGGYHQTRFPKFKSRALKRLLAPKLRLWYNTAEERCAAYEEALRHHNGYERFKELDSYQLMRAILDDSHYDYPLTGLDAVPILRDVRRCVYPNEDPGPELSDDSSNNQARKDMSRRRVTIKLDALRKLVDVNLKQRKRTAAERCVAYEEALRNEPDAGDFANLNRFELLRSIISSRRSTDQQSVGESQRIISDVWDCLFSNKSYEYRLMALDRNQKYIQHLPLNQKCYIVDEQVHGAMFGHPLYKASKAVRAQEAILDLDELNPTTKDSLLSLHLKECLNNLEEWA